MSFSHHGEMRDPEQEANFRRLLEQFEGTAKREYQAGRISPDDDGALSFGITTDLDHKRVIVRFGKPVEWIGLRAEDCVALAQQLIDRAKAIADKPLEIRL
jgi:hypothetical protein